MTCVHEFITTFHTSAGPVAWACEHCLEKFVPFSQLLTEVAEEREACARAAIDHHEIGWSPSCAAAIRARGQA